MKCNFCLSDLHDQARFCSNCGEPVGPTTKVCRKCNTESPSEANFCLKCGIQFELKPYRVDVGEENFRLHSIIKGTIDPFKEQGEQLLESGFVNEAEEMYKSGLKLMKTRFSEPESPSIANAKASLLIGMSVVHQTKGKYGTAYKILKKAQQELDDFGDLPSRLLKSEIHQLLGYNHLRAGESGIAAMNYYRGLGILNTSVENQQGAMLYQGLGMLFRSLGNNEDSKYYLERCRQIRLKIRDDRGTATASINLGVLFTQMGGYSTAENYYLDALRIYKQDKYTEGYAVCTANLGYIRFEQERYEEAIRYLLGAITNGKEACPWIIPTCYLFLARVAAAQKQPKKTIEHLDRARQHLGDTISLPNKAKLSEVRALAEFDSGNHEKSFELFNHALGMFEKANVTFDTSVCQLNFGRCLFNDVLLLKDEPERQEMKVQAVEQIGQAMDGFKSIGNEKYTKICFEFLESMDERTI